MEVNDILDLLSKIMAVAGSGWLGLATSGILLVFCLVAWGYLRGIANDKAFRDSKKEEIKDQINNREQGDKIESNWEKSQEAIKGKTPKPAAAKKKRTWLS